MNQSDDNNEDDDGRDDQGDDGEQADWDLFIYFRVGDAQVHEGEGPLEWLDIVDSGTDAGYDTALSVSDML